jgi:OmpA-OmpF porin, OOP family
MSFNLLEAARGLLPEELISKAALSLGETESNTRKALNGAIPSILAGLLHQSSRSEGKMIPDLLKSVTGSDAINHLTDLFESKKINDPGSPGAATSKLVQGWLISVFGGKLINIVNATSIYSDIKSSSASAILKIATPLALGATARYAEENKLGPAEIDGFLQNQKSFILSAIPVGFNLTGSLGVNSPDDIGIKTVNVLPEPHNYPRPAASNAGKWIWPLLLLVTFGGLVWFFSQRNNEKDKDNARTRDTTELVQTIPKDTINFINIGGRFDSLSGNFVYDQGAILNLKLPDSTILQTGQNSTEARLFNMLSDTSWHIDTTDKTINWITFDQVYFETGKSILTTESQTQVKNIANILKNFPVSSIKIGGYTDNQGDSVINKKIADERAKIVRNELIKLGAGVTQITEAVGYGPDDPVCPANDTPECRARNRRVDLKVAAK